MNRHPKRAPTHPGDTLREIVLPELGISQVELAQRLGISRQSLNRLLNKSQRVTPEMAVRLGKVVGSTPNFWLALQQQHDLWHAEREVDLASLKPLNAVSVAE